MPKKQKNSKPNGATEPSQLVHVPEVKKSEGNPQKIITFSVAGIATVFVAIAGILYFDGNKPLAIWSFFLAMILYCTPLFRYRRLLFSLLIMVCFLLFGTWHLLVWKRSKALDVEITQLSSLVNVGPKTNISEFLYVWLGSDGPSVTPIQVLSSFRIQNRTSKPIRIVSYHFEYWNNGRWIHVKKLDGTSGTIFNVGRSLASCAQLKIVTLDRVLAEQSIPPGDAVTGWVIFYDRTSPPMKLIAADSEGHVADIEVKVAKQEEGSIESSSLYVEPGKRDISGYKLHLEPPPSTH